MHVPMDQRSKPCIFMGYSEYEFDYKLWELVNKKVVRSRDIVFMEDKTSKTGNNTSRNLFPSHLPLIFQSTIQGRQREDNRSKQLSPR